MIYENATHALKELSKFVLDGEEVGSRNGRVFEQTNVFFTLERPWEREILLQGRKASLPAQIAETVWVLSGRNDVKWLSHYLPRAPEFSDDGKTWRGGYGPRLRSWGTIDQLQHVVDLLTRDPLTRRAVISIYDPAIDTEPGKDIPCNDFLMFQSRLGKLDMHVTTRSNDLMWGWSGINAFEWSALQEILAGLLGIDVGKLHFTIGSLHLYDRHWKKAGGFLHAGITVGSPSPRFDGRVVQDSPDHLVERLDELLAYWLTIEKEIRNGDFDQDDIEDFPEPMLQSWLRVIAAHWTKDDTHLDPIHGTALYHAALMSPKGSVIHASELLKGDRLTVPQDPFVDFVAQLHADKHAVYGDSWKRRGEVIGIMANIARKVDRLGVGGAGDTASDTAIDLLVYLIKYRLWLAEHQEQPLWTTDVDTDKAEPVSEFLRKLPLVQPSDAEEAGLVERLKERFEALQEEALGQSRPEYKVGVTNYMIREANRLARLLWAREQAEYDYWEAMRFWKGQTK